MVRSQSGAAAHAPRDAVVPQQAGRRRLHDASRRSRRVLLPPGLGLRRSSAAFRLINIDAHTGGTLRWVKHVAVPEAGAPMALRMFAGTYAVPEAGADRASSPLSVVRAFGAGGVFRVGCDRGTGSRLASRIEPVPFSDGSVFARSYECGQASAVSERAHGQGDIGAPASGTASLLHAFAPASTAGSESSSQPSSRPLSTNPTETRRSQGGTAIKFATKVS